MSETKAARAILGPYCRGKGLDIGYGGDCISPEHLELRYADSVYQCRG